MPSLKKTTKSTVDCVREKVGLQVCQKSSKISKNSSSHVRISKQAADLETCVRSSQDDNKILGGDEAVDDYGLLDAANIQYDKQLTTLVDSETVGRTDSTDSISQSNSETNFSPIASIEVDRAMKVDIDKGLPVECNNLTYENTTEFTSFSNYRCDDEPSMFFDMTEEEYMIFPYPEDNNTIETSKINDDRGCEDSTLYMAIHQMRSPLCNQQEPDSDQADRFDPHMFISDVADTNILPSVFPTEKAKRVTLVLDLDETLVHSTLEHCDNADFTFPVFFNLKEHIVYVKERPHLHTFLERVADMFEIVVFTASQSIYAGQLLDILDPLGNIISRRAYRESCTISEGNYTKDLTVLGVDLARIIIIDNTPQVFEKQVNNGIAIKSWFDDPTDCALISLLPFLETLAIADDVRPLIANRFGNNNNED